MTSPRFRHPPALPVTHTDQRKNQRNSLKIYANPGGGNVHVREGPGAVQMLTCRIHLLHALDGQLRWTCSFAHASDHSLPVASPLKDGVAADADLVVVYRQWKLVTIPKSKETTARTLTVRSHIAAPMNCVDGRDRGLPLWTMGIGTACLLDGRAWEKCQPRFVFEIWGYATAQAPSTPESC